LTRRIAQKKKVLKLGLRHEKQSPLLVVLRQVQLLPLVVEL